MKVLKFLGIQPYDCRILVSYRKRRVTYFNFSVGHESGIENAKKKADEVCADMCCDKVKLDSQINALYV